MDSFDINILKILQNNSRTSTETIGERVGLSATACQRRIKKLKQLGVIKKEVAVLDLHKIGEYLTVIIDVSLIKGGEEELDFVISKLTQEAQVQQLYYLAGSLDFTAIVVVKNMDNYDKLTRQLFFSNPNIKKFESKVVIKNEKVGLNVPL